MRLAPRVMAPPNHRGWTLPTMSSCGDIRVGQARPRLQAAWSNGDPRPLFKVRDGHRRWAGRGGVRGWFAWRRRTGDMAREGAECRRSDGAAPCWLGRCQQRQGVCQLRPRCAVLRASSTPIQSGNGSHHGSELRQRVAGHRISVFESPNLSLVGLTSSR